MLNWLTDKLKGWRTLIIAALLGAIDFVQGIVTILDASGYDLTPLIPTPYLPWWGLFHAVMMWYMRHKTSGPIGSTK